MNVARPLTWALLASLALSFLAITPAQAGTYDDPEVTDANDAALLGLVPACLPPNPGGVTCSAAPGFVNIQLGYVAAETADSVTFKIDGPNNPNSYGPTEFRFYFTVDGTPYMAGIHMDQAATGAPPASVGTGELTPLGVASSVRFTEDDPIQMELVVPRAAIGSPALGATMTELHIESDLRVLLGEIPAVFSDRAPDEGFGRDYTFIAGPAPAGGGADSDGDGLNDTWEQDNFGDLNQTGSDDPDDDGLNNTSEFDLGTDPNDADTDGDGISDGEEVANGTDPLDATDPGTGGASPGDSDGDGLNDTWEQDNFGDLNQTGSDDPDDDGLNNTAEFDLGTDPNDADSDDDGLEDGDEVTRGTDPLDADTDGDGLDDGDEVTRGTDPLDADTDGDGVSDGDEVSEGSDPLDGDDQASGGGSEGSGSGPGSASSEKSALDELQDDPGYLAISGAGLVSVVVLSIIGLAARWSA